MIMKQKMITYGIATCLTIALFTNCSKTNTPETIASVQQKIKGKWQVVRETSTFITPTTETNFSKDGDASHYYNFTADSALIISSPNFGNSKSAYKVTSPTQLNLGGTPMQIQTLTNSNCILYGQSASGGDGNYTTLTIELKK